jgi:hypothetical protein
MQQASKPLFVRYVAEVRILARQCLQFAMQHLPSSGQIVAPRSSNNLAARRKCLKQVSLQVSDVAVVRDGAYQTEQHAASSVWQVLPDSTSQGSATTAAAETDLWLLQSNNGFVQTEPALAAVEPAEDAGAVVSSPAVVTPLPTPQPAVQEQAVQQPGTLLTQVRSSKAAIFLQSVVT